MLNRIGICRPWIKLLIVAGFLIFSALLLFINATNSSRPSPVIKPTESPKNGVEKCASFQCSHDKTCRTSNRTCCVWILKRALLFVDDFFRKHNLSYGIVYGTLLGAVRNQSIIPWTRDIDIVFFNKSYLFRPEIRDELNQHGYHVFEAIGLTRFCIHQAASDLVLPRSITRSSTRPKAIFTIHAYVDLYVATPKHYNTTYNATIYSVEFSGKHLSPISFGTTAKIDDVSYLTVDNVEDHLVHFYGKQYQRDVIPRIP